MKKGCLACKSLFWRGLDLKDKKGRRYYKNKNFKYSLKNALNGLKTAILKERNMRTHILSTGLALLAGSFFQLKQIEWLWLLLAIFLVFICELLNTAIETIVDLIVGDQIHPLARDAKDIGAAVVITASLFAVIIGIIIFGPKLWNIF